MESNVIGESPEVSLCNEQGSCMRRDDKVIIIRSSMLEFIFNLRRLMDFQ